MRVPNAAFPTTLPQADAYSTRLLARSDLVGWWQMDPAHVVQSGGAISAVSNRKSGGAAFTQASAAAQPALTADAILDYYAASFDGGDFLACASALTELEGGPFTLACLFKAGGSASTQTVFSKRADNSNRIVLDVPANQQQVRAAIGTGTRALSVTLGGWMLAVMASNGTDTGLLRVNGVDAAAFTHNDATSTATPAIGSLSSSSMSLGLASGSYVSDLLVFSAYHPAASGLLALIEAWAVDTYGLGFTPAS